MRIALIGYGKMGRAIQKVSEDRPVEIIRIFDKNQSLEHTHQLEKIDVAIEFTQANAVKTNAQICFDAGVPLVSGTTGLTVDAREEIHALCHKMKGAFLHASNFSLGMHICFYMNKQLADIMQKYPQYHVAISETHHLEKRDTPSGTAITLAEQILDRIPNLSEWKNQKNISKDVLPVLSSREGEVNGLHKILYTGPDDQISLTHSASSRYGFARGALIASEWIQGKTGIFRFEDVLGFQ